MDWATAALRTTCIKINIAHFLFPRWAIFDMREIHRPCTRFLGLFSNLPCGNAVVHFIVQFENMTDVTFCPHTYKFFYYIRIIWIFGLRQCRHNHSSWALIPEPLRDVDLGGLQLEHSFQLCSTIRDDYRTFFTKCGELGSDDLLKSGLRELLQCDKVYRFAMDFVA